MRFSKNDDSAHSLLKWTYDDRVEPILITEIIRLLRSNQRGNLFQFSPCFMPAGQVDMLAYDISLLFNQSGFSKEATDKDAELRYANDENKRQKLVLIYDLVRGTLIANDYIKMD